MIGNRPWTPADDLTGIVAWYDASDADTITESGGNVSQWDDKSGNDYHLEQSNGGLQPEWGVGAQIDNKNVMHYAGTFDRMEKSGIADINCTEVALISVAQTQATGDTPAFGAIEKTDATDRFDFRGQRQTTQGRITAVWEFDDVPNYTANTPSSPEMADLTPYMVSGWYDGSQIVHRVNGGIQSASNASAPDGATFTINLIAVGRTSNTPRNYQGELIIINDLSVLERIEGYLAYKWGIA